MTTKLRPVWTASAAATSVLLKCWKPCVKKNKTQMGDVEPPEQVLWNEGVLLSSVEKYWRTSCVSHKAWIVTSIKTDFLFSRQKKTPEIMKWKNVTKRNGVMRIGFSVSNLISTVLAMFFFPLKNKFKMAFHEEPLLVFNQCVFYWFRSQIFF